MKRIYRLLLLPALIIFSGNIPVYSWEIYDRVIAVVNDSPIIRSELLEKYDRSVKQKKVISKKPAEGMSRVLDVMIEDSILEETAEKESIKISDEKINNQIKKVMERMKISSLEVFKKELEKTENMTFEEYKQTLRRSLMTEQVMSLTIGVSPPTTKEAEEWYKANKTKVGYEINIQRILIRMSGDSFEENKRVNKITNDLLNKIRNGQPFESIVREVSEDKTTKDKSGNTGWITFSDIAKNDIIFANNLYQEIMINKKQYAIVKSNMGYNIIKSNGSRVTSFESAREDIFNMLYQKNAEDKYNKWILERKSGSDVRIYMEDYVKDNAAGKSPKDKISG